MFAYGSFAVMAAGWLAFAVALVGSRDTLDDVWSAVGELPFVLEVGAWLAGFPFLLGLAIWQASWDEALRLVAIGAVATAYLLMFLPRDREGD